MRYTPSTITSTYAAIAALNANFAALQTLLEKAVLTDGTAPNAMLADLDLNHFQLKNLTAGTDDTDAVSLVQAKSLLVGTGTLPTVNVKWLGAKGDDTTDDTAIIQAAVNLMTSGGKVYFPRGTYKITAAITNTNTGVVFEGESRESTIIKQHTNAIPIVSNTGNYFELTDMRLGYTAATPTVGATAIISSGSYCTFHHFTVLNGYVDLELFNCSAVKAIDFELFDYEQAGLFCTNFNDIFVSDFIMNCSNTTRGTFGGIRLLDKAEAFVARSGDILFGLTSMTTDATVNSVGTRPAYSKFSEVYFDSSANGVLLDNSVELDFCDCWFSNRPGNGCGLTNTDGVRFTNGGAIGCHQHGVDVAATCKRTVFKNFASRGNSVLTTNTYSGIHFAANTTDFIVQGCMLDNNVGFGTQKYGVAVDAGTSDRYIIADNLVNGIGTAGVSDGGTGSNKRVANNY